MENRLSYILVGAFIFVLLIGGVLSILWLGNYSDKGTFKFYKVATKESVSGLNDKAPVKLRGVQIGEVRSITINPDNGEEVLVTIRVQDNAPIKEDTYAIIEAQGITGLSFIQLQGGTNEAKDLKTSNKAEEYGLIYSRPSTFSRLDKTITSLSAKAEMIFERAENIMSAKNVRNLEIIIENSAKIAESTNKTMANLEAQNKEINQLLKEATAAATGVKEMSHSFTSAIDNTGIDTMNKVREAAQNVTTVMGGLNQKIEKGSFDIDILVKENLMPLQQTLQELHVLVNETKDLVSNLKDSPSDLLFKEETIKPAPNER
ncbi:MlaD family protein [Sulfurospirillum oryzae]|uniref:MlaD family protein n=1 Tax=Sulfurospirillum oryzae TaxID=2976535 RepID=UPI0021E6F123|nr:MlaD family protein [Sulfurospirillum oryzae]